MNTIGDIVEATHAYEHWLAKRVTLVEPDIKRKHKLMRQSSFAFLRATYYRWVQLWPLVCPELAAAPKLLAVGDLHLENFGTWRDGEARLVWGINDFDEAHDASYANDLVRLAASARIAIDEGALRIGARRACALILEGYAHAMRAAEAVPFILEEANAHLRDIATSDRRGPEEFWAKIAAGAKATPPADARALLAAHLPKGTRDVVFARRTAGTGGLGLPRFIASGSCDGGQVAREAKARAPSSHAWAVGEEGKPGHYPAILAQAVRPNDPYLKVEERWIVRRLAPHCERIELADVDDAKARREVLRAMGRETANIHRGTGKAKTAAIVGHLARLNDGWLYESAGAMTSATRKDWKVWRKKAG